MFKVILMMVLTVKTLDVSHLKLETVRDLEIKTCMAEAIKEADENDNIYELDDEEAFSYCDKITP